MGRSPEAVEAAGERESSREYCLERRAGAAREGLPGYRDFLRQSPTDDWGRNRKVDVEEVAGFRVR